ncbi:sugar transferase [Streptomyces sp. ISL-111]|nr:sugar transferase [Streptomyces sp. ISL-111]MBT2379081.1 sugar transferase [Streptomyces sp. ISL-111]
MRNARQRRVRQKNQRKRQRRQQQRKQPEAQVLAQPRPRAGTEPAPQPPAPRAPARHAPSAASPRHRTRPPHPSTGPTGTARGHFPSRPAAHLADLSDRAGHLAARLTPRASAERVLDLTLGTALLIAAAPAITLGALALALRRGPGNVWERSPRTGLGGQVFTLRSLRTRRLRLDLLSRLPQVVRGELSLVGPAPLAPGDPRAAWPGARQWRQEVRPGLTGLAQVRARSGMPWDDPALLDQHYAEHHGVVLDLAILAEAVRNPLRTALRRARPTKAHLSDTDHRPPGYSGAE